MINFILSLEKKTFYKNKLFNIISQNINLSKLNSIKN